MTIYKLEKLTHLDKFNKCYVNVIAISKNPNDANLNGMLKTISRQKLSIFDYNYPCNEKPHCLNIFIHPETKQYLKSDELDVLFSFLIDAGYTIEYKMTKLVKNKNIICFISKN